MAFSDEWLVPTLATIVPEAQIVRLRRELDGTPSVWEAVVDRRFTTDNQVLNAVAARFRLPIADLMTGGEVRLLLAPPGKIRDKVDEIYRPEDMVSKLLSGITSEHQAAHIHEAQDTYTPSEEEASQRPIIKLVDTLIGDGITSRASDIHVEPAEGGLVVRYRIDGVLRQVMKMPRSAGLPLVSRIKIMSGMDIADRLRPQDGRCRVSLNGNPVDLRVSTLPASHGEKVVIRILTNKSAIT